MNVEELWRRKLGGNYHMDAPEADPGPGLITLDDQGAERYARLQWRDVMVFERMPLHFWKMGDSAKEMEVRRITMALIKKMKRVYGIAPDEIIGEQDA